jgi:hypothetical protein
MTNNDIEPGKKQKQIRRVVEYMKTHPSISQREADTISVKRLSARISDMKVMGYRISDKWVNGVNQYGDPDRYKIYWLEN